MTIQPHSEGKRIVFLDSLRAIAVLLVLWGHVFLIGIGDANTVGIWVPDVKELIFGPTTVTDNFHGKIGMWLALQLGVNVGGLGVSLFFLISGFVILRTIDRTPPLQFMIQRLFRIVPVCFFCVALVAGITYVYCSSRGLPQPNSITSILTSSIAANYFNGAFVTVPVLWTLEIEMFFYIVMAISVSVLGRLDYKSLCLISLVCLGFVANYAFPYSDALAKPDMYRHFSTIFVFISYMMIGAFIYRAYEDKNVLRGLAFSVISVALCGVSYYLYEKATNFQGIGSDLASSTAALIIFVIGLFAGMHGKLFAPLRWIASISYPLYLLHIPLAWGMIYVLASMGIGMYWCATLSTVAVIILAWATHRTIELPSQALGKTVSNLVKKSSPAVEGEIA
ncbi:MULTISPECIES: acyltransferase family protein [unclassified Pseudomonas]|uniref:Acyltransferase n=1 Tax=Pseudomonas sp. MYb327 TaxID=2745230 RepID=A0AAU8E639_9PSED